MRKSKCICMTIGFLLSVTLSITLVLMNCGGGGGGDGGGTGPTSEFGAFNFTAANMTTAASIAANTTGFWPPFTQITFGMMEQLQTSPTPTAGQPHDLGMCVSGTGTFTWTDKDLGNTLSEGDAVALNFSNCDVGSQTEHEYLNGTVNLLFTTVLSGPTTTFAANVTINVTSQSTDTVGFSGALHVSVVIINGDNVTFNYTPGTQNGVITAKVNGTTAYELGCFNVNHKFNMLTPMQNNYLYMLEPSTVIKTSNKIMSLMPAGYMGFRDGTPDEYADFFGSQLISLSVPECAALGVPNGVGDSDGNYIKWFAPTLYDDDVTLELYDKNNTLMHTINTNWGALY